MGADFVAVGGASYASVGCLRTLEWLASSDILYQHSSKYFLVVKLDKFIIVIFALPTGAETTGDAQWAAQLQLGAEAGNNASVEYASCHQIWMGDFNYEPACIGIAPDPPIIRTLAYENMATKYKMRLLNPGGTDCDSTKIALPIQEKIALLRRSSAFTGGRGIDLALISVSFESVATVIVHNGIHCKEHDCVRPNCNEFSFSDHFLQELILVELQENVSNDMVNTRPKMPAGFHDSATWDDKLEPFVPFLTCLASSMEPTSDDWRRRLLSRRFRQAEANVLATCLEVFFLLVTVLWCATMTHTENKKSKQPSHEAWQVQGIKRAAESDSRVDAVTSLLRAV